MEDVNPLLFFVVAASSATTLATLQELREGWWDGPALGSHLTRGAVVNLETRSSIQLANRAALAVRIIGPILILAGIFPRAGALATALALTVTLLIRFKHNTLFTAVGMTVIACTPAIPTLRVADVAAPDPWTLGSVTILLVGLYIGGGIAKLQSDQFRSGSTIFLIWITKFPSTTECAERVPHVLWRTLGLSVIALEIIIPFVLSIPGALIIALAIGGIIHVGFSMIQPGRLIPFQIATLGSYPAAASGFALLW
jgi:uncharacterized membrane protein YphA (DoxX/SURF4 family)